MPSMNDNYEEMGYESTSVLINMNSLIMTIMNGAATWVIVFGVRAIIFTLRGDVKKMENELNEMDNDDIPSFHPKKSQEQNISKLQTKREIVKKKMKKWGKSKHSHYNAL